MSEVTGIISDETARALLAEQFPDLAHLPIIRFDSTGTDNLIFRLGEDLCLRFPKADWAALSAPREVKVLPYFEDLPLQVPKVVGLGAPGHGYPWQWSVMSWVPGEAVGADDLADMAAAAGTLADFLRALQTIPVDAECLAGKANNYRGVPLQLRDTLLRNAADQLADLFDKTSMLKVWEICLSADEPTQPLWLHGDIHGGNMLKQNGQLSAIIDWGLAGVGDAACDLSAAWAVFDTPARRIFFECMEASEAEQLRGAGWALSIAAIFLAYNRERDAPTDLSKRTISRVLGEFT